MSQEIEDPEDFNDPEMSLNLDGNCREWHRDGKLHRDNDLPALKWSDGNRVWFQHGEIHRENGPAHILPDGAEMYYIHGEEVSPQRHRQWREELTAQRERERQTLLEQVMEAAQDMTVLKTSMTIGRALRFQPKAACL